MGLKANSKWKDELKESGLVDTKLENMTGELINHISEIRENLIKSRLKELNIDIDLKEEEKRLFKRFAVIHEGNKTTYYYNDGTVKGLRIITFITDPPEMEKFKSGELSYSINTRYQ